MSEIKPSDFVHLHSHTDFSLLDGAARVDDLVKKVHEVGQKAIAVTDHGWLGGIYELDHAISSMKKKVEGFDVKPIYGLEAYVTPGTSRHDSTKVKWSKTLSGDDADESDNIDGDVSAGGSYTHMTLWAENNEGFKNLKWMDSIASMDAVMRWPRIDKELMNNYSKGIIASTGCPSSAVATRLRLGQFDEALKEAAELQDIFGKDNLFVEIMDHGLEFERAIREDLLRLAKKIGAPLVATNDLHYVSETDALTHEHLLCLNSGSKMSEPTSDEVKKKKMDGTWEQFRSEYNDRYGEYPKGRFAFGGSGYYVKTAAQMHDLFKELPEALANTVLIAERCNTSLDYMTLPKKFDGTPIANLHMPKIALPDGETENSYFSKLVFEGLKMRFKGKPVPENYEKQAKYEVDMIVTMGFSGYFLVVSDFIIWAKENSIAVGPGRGSAAGSIVSWSLRITDLDPIEHKLVFERFLNPERVSLPDIDVDFEEGGRDQVVKYCAEKYGSEYVAQIMTIGRIAPKSAVKDTARILGRPIVEGENLAKAIPSKGMITSVKSLKDIFKKPDKNNFPNGDKDEDFREANTIYSEGDAFRKMVETGLVPGQQGNKTASFVKELQQVVETGLVPGQQGNSSQNNSERSNPYKKIYDSAVELEGLIRQTGVHAGGVIISPVPIPDVVPVMRRQADNAIITQYDAHGCEDLGLVKMDFLGLKNLNTVKQTLLNIKKTTGKDIVLEDIPLDDKATFELISEGSTLGVFQLDGGGMRELLVKMKPTKFEHISATIALYRPGPMGMNSHNEYADRKNGLKKAQPIHAEVEEALAEILDDTYGLIVYQEQIQFAAQKLAGYSLGQADLLRRAMGKKIEEVLLAEFKPFSEGMKKNGYSDEAIKKVWDVFVPFADYAFNRAHSAAYGVNAYYNAYLKANFPTEYMAALLTTFENNKDKMGIYLAECARMGISVLVPDVNLSSVDFLPIPEKKQIRFGLGAIRNVGEGVAIDIINTREEKGNYESFLDFLKKVPSGVCNKLKVQSLLKSGAFDTLGLTRRAMMNSSEIAIQSVMPVKQREAQGQIDLFSALDIGEEESGMNEFDIEIENAEEWPKRTFLNFEKEMLGRYVSSHPLSGIAKILENNSTFPIASLRDPDVMKDYVVEAKGQDERRGRGVLVEISGLITSVVRKVAKSGNEYAIVKIEDLTSEAEVSFFGSAYKECIDIISPDQVVKIEARITVQGEEDNLEGRLSARNVEILNVNLDQSENAPSPLTITIGKADSTPDNLKSLRAILAKYPGSSPVVLRYFHQDKIVERQLPEDFKVDNSSQLRGEIRTGAVVENLS